MYSKVPTPYTEREMVAFVAEATSPASPSAQTIRREYDASLFASPFGPSNGVGQGQGWVLTQDQPTAKAA